MSDSVRPHGLQPTRLLRPWDSPGKNTGVGCHCLLQCMKVENESQVAQSCPTLSDPMDYSLPGSSIHGIFQARVLEWGAIAFSFLLFAAAKSLQSCPTLCEPHRPQPTRLRRPRDSPGKNTGVGCHFLLQHMKVKSESEVAQLYLTLSDPMDSSLPGSAVHGIFQAILEWGAIALHICMQTEKSFPQFSKTSPPYTHTQKNSIKFCLELH